MKNRLFDVAVIVGMVFLLVVLNQLGLLEKYAKFALIPFLVFYFLGKYAERRIKRNS